MPAVIAANSSRDFFYYFINQLTKFPSTHNLVRVVINNSGMNQISHIHKNLKVSNVIFKNNMI